MKQIDNFKKALINLRLAKEYEFPYDVVTQTGLVNLFIICFEQSWKAMKEIIEKIKMCYIQLFEELEKEIKEKWL